MNIQILGSGCPTCKKLHEVVEKIVQDEKLDAKVEYITGAEGMQKIIELGQMGSPVLVVDGKVTMIGYTPDTDKIKQKILTAAEK